MRENNTPEQQPLGADHGRIARYDQYFDSRTYSTELRKTQAPKKQRNKKYALVVRRIINHKGQHEGTEVDIISPVLCDVLKQINTGVEGLNLNRSQATADPNLFFHSQEGLKARYEEEMSKERPDESMISDISLALQFIEEDQGGNIADFGQLVSHGEITYDLLWALFPPNTVAYYYHEMTEQDVLVIVRSVKYRQHYGGSYLEVTADCIRDDGKMFGLAKDMDQKIVIFSGSRKIQDLSIFPLKYHPKADEIKEHSISRGKRFLEMKGACYHEISGPAMKEIQLMKGADGQEDVKRLKFNTYGRVMIDPVAFRTFEPNCTYNFPVHKRMEREDVSDEDLSICTPILLGFCFGVKMWGGFAIDNLEAVVWGDEAFHSLVLGEQQKNLIHALVNQHKRRSSLFDDVVVGKGKGLIGLFSGGPGCGKTLTAEAIAEITQRPLYTISAGELGTEVTEVDKNLTKILELSRTWNAVLLLDEAEVYLQKRNSTDVSRNALVSIFLRQLEYYQGILILTTNLIANCDPAFESRIHFSLYYPELDFDSRMSIWKTFFKQVAKSGAMPIISEEDVEHLAKRAMNGRQIRNIISNAQALALESGSSLSIANIDEALNIVSDWETVKAAMPPF
ncbi:P-loop containing nucleoside triphosphate hydrolase protein [Hysterangium stoloniferum]|nr:P-loop containing nucleoside triphosphate hydrolase protein [Hysterangium stoloniferum]